MKALIDFDGWRRWKGSDSRDPNETKRGFSVGPQVAARNLASRLRIDRNKGTQPPLRTLQATESPSGPEIQIYSATPKDTPSKPDSNPLDQASVAETSLEVARIQLVKNNLPHLSIQEGDTTLVNAALVPPANVLPDITEDSESPLTRPTNLPSSHNTSETEENSDSSGQSIDTLRERRPSSSGLSS